MSTFGDRLKNASLLEESFTAAFNNNVKDFKIIKYGIESTKLAESHKYIRACHDATSRFIRYIPDSVLINTEANGECPTALIEFKASRIGVEKNSFLNFLKTQCPSMKPPFTSKSDIFNIENDALELYKKLHEIGVTVIVVGYAKWFDKENCLRSQYIENISKCNVYNPPPGGEGSRTPIANVNFASFQNAEEFFNKNFGISDTAISEVKRKVIEAFV